MAHAYRSREGDVTAADTKTELTTLGSETAPGVLRVPEGFSKISRVFIAAAHDGATIAADGTGTLVRIEGDGLPNGPETLAGPSIGFGTAVNTARDDPSLEIPVDFQVTPGNQIQIFGEMDADIGTLHLGVTLEFS